MSESKTFCIYPWIHQMTTPTGKASFCCIAEKEVLRDETGKPILVADAGFDPAWNSSNMREIRKNMLEGKPVKGCEVCSYQEKIGKRSYRQQHNEEWMSRLGRGEINRRIEQSRNNQFAVNEAPVYLDLRLGNLCNLKCRMCNPYNSIQIHKEWNAIDETTGGEMTRFWAAHDMANRAVDPWWESDAFWQSCESAIPSLKKVYMTGGEPTLIQGNYRFMRKCIETGHARNIELFFNINCTRLTDEFIDLINQFKWTNINASLDGVGPVNEYIRYPSHWETISKNFEKLARHSWKNVGLGVSPVIQIYNVLEITHLLDYVEDLQQEVDREILVDFLYCLNPRFLRIELLPRKVRDQALEKLKAFRSRSRFFRFLASGKSRFIRNGVESMMTLLQGNPPSDAPEMLAQFYKYTRMLDQHRNQNFESTFPELAQLMKEEGYPA